MNSSAVDTVCCCQRQDQRYEQVGMKLRMYSQWLIHDQSISDPNMPTRPRVLLTGSAGQLEEVSFPRVPDR